MAEKTKQVKKSDVGHYDLFSVINQTSDLIIKDHKYGVITSEIKDKIDEIFENYLSIGYLLLDAKKYKIYEVNNYKNIYDYASKEFDLSSTTTKNVMNIVTRFCDENGGLLDKYENYSFSNLVELLPVPDSDIDKFTPSMTVKSIRDKKLQIEINKQLKKFFNKDGVVTKLICEVESFDWNNHLKTTGYKIEHSIDRDAYESTDKDYWGSKYNFVVRFVLIKQKSKLEFVLEFELEEKEIKFDIDRYYIGLKPVSDDNPVEKNLKAIAKKFVDLNIVLKDEDEKKESKNNASSSNHDNDVSPGYSLLKNIKVTWNDGHIDSSRITKNIISELNEKYFYESFGHGYDNNINIHAEGKRNKKKNPPLYQIKDIDDPLLTTVNVFDENGEIKESIKVFEGIDKFISEKLKVLKEIIK